MTAAPASASVDDRTFARSSFHPFLIRADFYAEAAA
jgi:hypothetical protein